LSIALVFPGQGSQYVGMGRDLYEAYPQARAVFEEADRLLGFPLSRLCFEGPKEELNDTINTQPAILAMSVACFRVLEAEGRLPAAGFVAGHSLGEYTALVAAGAIEFADALRLVRERGRLMKEAGERNPGGMAAIINLSDAILEAICYQASRETGGIVQVANYNSPGQIVISGERKALERAMDLAREQGAARVVPLAVSIAAHSPLMGPAAQAFRWAVEGAAFREARIPVVANISASPITAVAEIKQELVQQLTSSVRWTESVQFMIEQGVDTFVEIGPKSVLCGLIRRIDRGVRTIKVGTVAEAQSFSLPS